MTNVPTYNDTIPKNTKYSIAIARRIMLDYIRDESISKNKLPSFIGTNHESVRGLIDYSDAEFDKINKTAFEDILSMDLNTLYEGDNSLARELVEDLGYTEREKLTVKDILEGNALNFYSVLDVNDENVMRAIGKHGYKQFIKTGNIFNSIKMLFSGEGDTSIDANAKVIARQGWKEAILYDIFRALDGVEGANYPEDFQRGSPPYIQLTELEESQWGDDLAEWASKNNIGPLNMEGEIPRLPNNRRLNLKEMTDQQFYDFLNMLGDFSPIKWKTFLKKLGKKWIEGTFTIPGTIQGELPENANEGESANFSSEDLENLMEVSDDYLAQVNEYIDKLNPPNVVEVQRRGVEDVDLTELDETIVRDTSMVERIETVSPEVLKTVIKNHLIESKGYNYDLKVSSSQKKYTLSTKEQDWTPADEFLNVKAGRPPYDKISSKGSFTNKMDIPLGQEYDESLEDIVDKLMISLVSNETPKEITEFLNIVETIESSSEEIETFYTQITGEALAGEAALAGDDEGEQETLEDDGVLGVEDIGQKLKGALEPFIVEDRQDLLEPFQDMEESFRQDLNILRDICSDIADVFGNYIQLTEGSSNILIQPVYNQRQIKDLERFEMLLELDVKSLRNLTEPTTIEEIESNFEKLFETEEGEEFKTQYDNILNNGELSEDNFNNLRSSLAEFFSRTLELFDSGGDERLAILSYLEMIEGDTEIDKLTNIIYSTLTNESDNPKKWGQPTKYTSAGKINFEIIVVEKSTGVEGKSVSNYKEQFQIKVVSSLSGVDFFSDRQKSFAQSEGARGKTYNVTTEGKSIAVKGSAVDKVRKGFIDKIEIRIQLLDTVI